MTDVREHQLASPTPRPSEPSSLVGAAWTAGPVGDSRPAVASRPQHHHPHRVRAVPGRREAGASAPTGEGTRQARLPSVRGEKATEALWDD